ncbi:hypothetical protein GS676_02935 [Rhodococcus hoagii]|nr:hypothetical protein [Prescottella equi]MBM4558192.1 hypothetical protein [Prescottella equi]NKT41820.1 hypothetical protein [Prescottella equi]
MGTAILVHEDLGGYAGVAHCYELSPPLLGAPYVTVWVQTDFGTPEAVIVAAHETGAAVRMNRLPGSYVHPDATHTGALWLAGYEVAQ